MTEEKGTQIEKLYNLAVKSKESARPKRALFGWKCPKCDSKLRKESAKEMIAAAEAGNEFAKKVVSEAGGDPGVYELSINHFTCKCGYEFAEANLEPFRDTNV